MAYGDIIKLTSQGEQLAGSPAAVYTAPTGVRAQIGTILLHNTSTSSNDVKVYVNGDTDADRILYITLDPSETYEFSPKVPLTLEGDETLEGEAENADEVNIIALGREEEIVA
jgi:hypothetical protein